MQTKETQNKKLVVVPRRERPYDSSGEENTGMDSLRRTNLKKRKLNTQTKSSSANYDADNEDEHTKTVTSTEERQPKKRLSIRTLGAPAVFDTTLIHRNVDELLQQWQEKIQEAENLEKGSLVISWNGSTMIWNHRDRLSEVVYIFVRPSSERISEEDIDHTISEQSQAHVERFGRGDPDLQNTIREYFQIVKVQLIKRLKEINAQNQTTTNNQRGNDQDHYDQWQEELKNQEQRGL